MGVLGSSGKVLIFFGIKRVSGKWEPWKNRHLDIIAQLCRTISLQLRHVSTIGKKLVKQQYVLQMSPQYGELRPTNCCDLLASLGHPSKFQPVSRLGFVTAATSLNGGQWNFAGCLTVSWAATLYMHFEGLLPANWFSPAAKFTLRPSLAFSYIGSVTAQHSSSGRQPNFVAWYKEWNLRNFRRGRHIYLSGRPSRLASPTFYLQNIWVPYLECLHWSSHWLL